jgi:hypothetical protein
MFFTLQEAHNKPTGASVPALGLYNTAICSLLYRKPRTNQKELVFLLQDCTIKEHIALLYSPKAGTLAPSGLFWASCKVKNI